MKVTIKVKPSSKKGEFVQPAFDGSLLVHVKEPAIGGKANRAVIKLLAEHYDVTKSQIEIIRGLTSSIKVISIDDS
ncbi:hypothetical protein A3F37_03005 [Candidatus Saccharibacteria bacterium RIFCSPHIGHO2_12_FULL_41_12]|nr:MAG: hypothetical protein A3F37_03005 [Candidatus Saccharibacteria bacterium RIFCSPHIGHO2_12_FULL_41_12]